jgi:tripartite-type tricarboxylate transporter receptor subunit TctC
MLRVVGEKLGKTWGQQVVIENRPGVNGFIAIDAAKKAAPDGYTVAQMDDTHLALQPHLSANIEADSKRYGDIVKRANISIE